MIRRGRWWRWKRNWLESLLYLSNTQGSGKLQSSSDAQSINASQANNDLADRIKKFNDINLVPVPLKMNYLKGKVKASWFTFFSCSLISQIIWTKIWNGKTWSSYESLKNKKNLGNHPHHKLEVITSHFQVNMSHERKKCTMSKYLVRFVFHFRVYEWIMNEYIFYYVMTST